MKKSVLSLASAVAVALLAAFPVTAADAKEVTLTGTLVCGKCKLKEAKKCTNVLQVKEGGRW